MDEETLLRELAGSPQDALLRLAYADWLEERGDARSEFLRLEDRLRRAPSGDPSRRGLGRALMDLRGRQDPAWLARVEPEPPAPGWLPAGSRRPPREGLADWEEWSSQSHYEFVVLAALAPIGAVARALVEARAGREPGAAIASGLWRPDVPVRPAVDVEYESPSGLIPLAQLKGHAWTVAIYDTFNLTMPSYDSAQADAMALSDRLGTLAVEFSHEDTSSATGYHLFDCGELVEAAEMAPGDGRFSSRRRPRPPWEAFPPGYPDGLFRGLGLYVPGFFAASPGGVPVVRAGIPGPDDYARADLIDLAPSFRRDPRGPRERPPEWPGPVHFLGDPEGPGEAGPPAPEDGDLPF